MRLILRRDWLAAGAWGAIVVLQNVLGGNEPWTAGLISVIVAAMMASLFRFGLLAFGVAMLFVTVLTEFPLTSSLGAWYGTGSAVALVALAGVTLYGFRLASAGKPLLGAAVD